MHHYDDFLHDENEYSCPECGGPCTFREITAGGMVGVACDDYDCPGSFPQAGLTRQITEYGETPTKYEPPEEWVEGEVSVVTLVCPECQSEEVKRDAYDDGLGHCDIKIQCETCNASTWQ